MKEFKSINVAPHFPGFPWVFKVATKPKDTENDRVCNRNPLSKHRCPASLTGARVVKEGMTKCQRERNR